MTYCAKFKKPGTSGVFLFSYKIICEYLQMKYFFSDRDSFVIFFPTNVILSTNFLSTVSFVMQVFGFEI